MIYLIQLYNYSKEELKEILIEDGLVEKSQTSSNGSIDSLGSP